MTGEPVSLDLDLSYAVCKDICVPAEAKLGRTLSGSGGDAAAIEKAMAAAPRAPEPGSGYGVVSSELVTRDGAPVLRVAARFPRDAVDPQLLVEGPADWYLPVPQRTDLAEDGTAVFDVDLPKDADAKDATFTATGLSPSFSFEQPFRLD